MSAAAAMAAVRVPSARRPGLPVDGAVDALPELPELFVPEASQWLSTSASRLACDGYSWLQAVHWVAGSGLYVPRRHRKDGAVGFGPSTLLIAQELAAFIQCRPGIELLMERTGLKRRMVKYHLQMLRETGLLVWVALGTREEGGKRLASEYVLVIPPTFDQALGIRTVQRHEAAPDYTRAVAGISEAGRALMTKLAKKAARKVRKPRKKPAAKGSAKASLPVSPEGVTDAGDGGQEPDSGTDLGQGHCTPMQGGSSTVSTAGSTPDPSEDKLASGQHESSHPKKARRGPRKRNRVGQRFVLAGELMRRVPWLRAASKDRIAWVVGEVSDAGWSADEVLAALDLRQEPPGGVRRASGFLAARMRGMTTMPGWTTRQQRQVQVDHRNAAVDAARKDRIQQVRDQHERTENIWQAPRTVRVRREVDAALAYNRARQAQQQEVVAEIRDGDGPIDLTELTRGEVAGLRAAAQANPALITSMIAETGEAYARRLYSNTLVDQVLNPQHSTLIAPYQPGRTA